MTYNPTNRKHIREAEKRQAENERARIEFLTAAMNTSQGRWWFHEFLASCQVLVCAPTFESNKDYFSFGERNVGLRILAEITAHCPDQYILMEKEAYVRQYTIDTTTERSSSEDHGRDLEGRGNGSDPADDDLYSGALDP
jgi:hypothetical protein